MARGGLSALSLIALGCAPDFSTARTAPPVGSMGRVLYSVVCDRVGAQSLPTDVTGASFRSLCHPDPTTGAYGDKVDVSQLPPLEDGAKTLDGVVIPLAAQQATRAHEIARVEALGRDREKIVAALDTAIPDARIPVLPAPPGATPCDRPTAAADVSLHAELGATLGRLIDLYDDAEQTIPSVTRAMGRSLDDIKADPDVQSALARLDARQGYRPIPLALGTVRSILSYPRFVELTRSVVTPLLSEPGQPAGPEAQAYDALMRTAYHELRSPGDPTSPIDLVSTSDPMIDGLASLTRPRAMLEGIRDVLSYTKPGAVSASPTYIVQRDTRGYAAVPLVQGTVPAPFVDLTGPNGTPDKLPDVDPLGRFITTDGAPPSSPFFTPDGTDGARDLYGRATLNGAGSTMYGYVDAYKTALAAIARDARPFFAPGAPVAKATAMDALAALPVLAGSRDVDPVAMKQYPPDPYAVQDWKVGHTGTPPAGLGATPVAISYRAFHPEDSPIADLLYALGQVLSAPEMDDLLALAQQLFANHPNDMASLMGLALEIRATAAKHPEATLPDQSTLWDDVFVRLAPVAHESGLLEDILRAFADPNTLPLEQALELFVTMKDDVSYDTNELNGPSKDLDNGSAPPVLSVPVDHSQPDVGANRSELQKFLSLLHDTNGLSICTKDGAIVHIKGAPGSVVPTFDYPTDAVLTPLICGLVGAPVPPPLVPFGPPHLNRCAVFGYSNVMSLLLDVLLDKAQLTVNDPCLNKLMASPITSLVGGADAFLQVMSGVQGFSLHPNLRGFARLLYFETQSPGLPTDPNAGTTFPYPDGGVPDGGIPPGGGALTFNFLKDTIDPIESMVCDLMPVPVTSGGITYPLRTCKTPDDTLRGRDKDALFPVDDFGFVPSLRPLATAFDKHHQPLLFADLFDVLHIHYGSSKQPPSVCDPTLPRSNARWCSQDGLVTWEPLFAEILHNGFFARIQSFLSMLAGITISHCTASDPQTHLCTTSVKYDGVHVAAQALSLLLDPQRTPGLVDRKGSPLAQRNDGQPTDPLSGMSLLTQAFKNIDGAFAAYASAHTSDTGRHDMWLAARSNFVDTFLPVNGKGPQASFGDTTLIDVLPKLIGVLRDQVAAHRALGDVDTWAQQELPSKLSSSIRGPMFAALADLLEALRKNDGARLEIEQLVTYLLDAASGNDTEARALASILDMTQALEDGQNMPPFERVMARAMAPPITDENGKIVRRSLADAGMRTLTRIFELETAFTGAGTCVTQRDPNRAIGALLQNMVTPMASDQLTPIEVFMDAVADVNRADPSVTTKLAGDDYGNVASEMSDFCLDPTRGLEQFYAVIKQITGGT